MSTSPLDKVDADISESWQTVDGLVQGFFASLPKMGIALVVFLVFWLVARTVRKGMQRARFGDGNPAISLVFGRIAYWILLIVGTFVALTIVLPSLTPGQLISGLGIGGLAIGFAFQDIFQNLIAGIMILVRQPFRVGDEIESGDYSGRVEAIETRATFIRTFDNRRVIIPNKQIYSDPLTVMTAYPTRRSEYDVGIGYGDDIDGAQAIMLEAVAKVDGVLADPAPQVLAWTLESSWVALKVRWWTHSARGEENATRSEVIKTIANSLKKAGIDMPFDTRVVLFHDQTEEGDGDRTRQREGWPAKPGEPPTVPARLVAAKGG